MDSLTAIVEGLLISLATLGTIALDLLLLIWIIFCLMIIAALLRWSVGVAYNAGKAAYYRSKNIRSMRDD